MSSTILSSPKVRPSARLPSCVIVVVLASGLTSASLSHTSFQDYLLLNAHRQSSQAAAAANTKGTRGRGMERQPSRLLRQDFQDREGITDGLDQFHQIQGALKALNYSESEICSIWNIVGAVLEIGNISFVESETQTGSIEISNRTYLDNAAALLGITDEKLRACLTTTVSTVRGETIVKQLDLRDSINAKNAVCKSLYSSLFQHIVGTINIALANNSYFFDDSFTSIGVLDIFGFESFRKNEFEQVSILPPSTPPPLTSPSSSLPNFLSSLPYRCSSTMRMKCYKAPSTAKCFSQNCFCIKLKTSLRI
jgi:hypothetical protein